MENNKNIIFKFEDFKLNEEGECGTCSSGGNANATLSNGTGMGDVVAPIPSTIPGDVAGSTKGSGDLPAYDLGNRFGFLKGKRKKMRKPKTSIKNFSDWTNSKL